MPRGRQYYDPILQVPDKIEDTSDLSRVELYPEVRGDGLVGRWVARRIGQDGLIAEVAPGDLSHDGAMSQASLLWPDLQVFELHNESDDSTWTGIGPSPRTWQAAANQAELPRAVDSTISEEADRDAEPLGRSVRAFTVSAGTYVLLDDMLALLESYACQFEVEKNPSGALALREAADALKDIG